ncbi:carboxymuconolactone decarboxylase family protein [Sandaracinus amylolyticus]|uniref:carboxymuconolactone decarboxylase family protein n=1 Tax=Sandaracinus amylolyticus TaxID=927083 RepID=UPI001F166FF7|nr:carboxymuconolactone decarboxylase family protein [Sandaracinus amylolyticus]UJR82007.1 Alkyl hydroperoxide reductase subunit D [Sandaracinus amylolyticus]
MSPLSPATESATVDVERIRDALPEAASDLRLNLQSVLGDGALTPVQRYGVAIACAHASRDSDLVRALITTARAQVEPALLDPAIDDARAAAALMGMNNVYYRFRHLVAKESYSQMPARLRMQRIARTKGPKLDFELFCLAVSAIGNCETCIRSHEEVLNKGGVTEAAIHDAVRIAATVHGVAVALST